MDARQQQDIEKVAGLISTTAKGLYNAGKAVTAPLDWAATGARYVASPFMWAGGKALKGAGNVVGGAFNHVVNPALLTAGKAAAGTAGAVGAAGAGVATGLGNVAVKNVAAPAVRWFGRRFKEAPISTAAHTGLGSIAVGDMISKSRARPFTTGSHARRKYDNIKSRFHKVGMDMTGVEKNASALGAVKKLISYGGAGPSMLGLGTMAALSPLVIPSLQEAGESVKRTVFPVSDRIRAEEEIAKKQLSMATEHQMKSAIRGSEEQRLQTMDAPVIEDHLNYLTSNDPIINDFALQGPSNVDSLRDTMYTVYNYAPDIATNRQAAQSILREAVTSPDGGLNYNTVKLIADAQKTIRQGHDLRYGY